MRDSDADAVPLVALGLSLRKQRRRLGLGTVAVAEAAGISRMTLHRIERGEGGVAVGAYMAVAAALGMTLQAVDSNEATRAGARTGRGEEGSIPLAIPVEDFPTLKGLAWQVAPGATLSPREVLDTYERNWRHVDESALSDEESELIANLRRVFEGERGV